MKKEIISCKKYLNFELNDMRSSIRPIKPINEHKNITSDNSLVPFTYKAIILKINTKEIKNTPPLFNLGVECDDLSLGISLKISPIFGIEFFITNSEE